MKRFFITITLFAVSVNVFAANEDIKNVTVTKTIAWGDNLIVHFTPSYTDSQNCSASNGKRIVLRSASDPDFDVMLSSLLAAAVSGKQVDFRVDGCGGFSYDYPMITRISVHY